MDWTQLPTAPEHTPTRPLKGNQRLGHWLTDDPKVFEAFERQHQNKRPHVSLITTSADVEDAACMGLDGVRFARLYMDPQNPLTDEVIRALSPNKKSCPFNNLYPSALPPGTPSPSPQDPTAAALLALAAAHPLPKESDDEHGQKEKEEAAQRAAEVKQKIALLQNRLSHGYDFTKDPPPRPMLLNYIAPGTGETFKNVFTQPFLPQGKVGMFVAPGGTGKTQALSQLAVSVATGLPWFDCFHVANIPGQSASKGRVLLALGEEDEDEIKRRVNPYIQSLFAKSKDKSQLQNDLRSNLKPLALDGAGPRMLGAKPDYKEEVFFSALYELLEQGEEPWRLIILDPASRFMGPDCETDNNAATRFIELVEQLTKLPGSPTVLLAHHTRKGSGNDGKDAARGSSALTDGARWVAQLKYETIKKGSGKDIIYERTGNILLDLDKSNYTKRLNKPITLQFNEDGWLKNTEEPNHSTLTNASIINTKRC